MWTASIHRSAWKWNSATFALTEFYEVLRKGHRGLAPLASSSQSGPLPLRAIVAHSPSQPRPLVASVAWDTCLRALSRCEHASGGLGEKERGSERMSEAAGRAEMERRLVE